MTRAEALAALIPRVEADRVDSLPTGLRADAGLPFDDFYHAWRGSLDAVARLEAPLRERGLLSRVDSGEDGFSADWWADPDDNPIVATFAPTEARARLLAVLRALHHEATP